MFGTDSARVGLLASATISTGGLSAFLAGMAPAATVILTLVQIAVAVVTFAYIVGQLWKSWDDIKARRAAAREAAAHKAQRNFKRKSRRKLKGK